MTSLSIPSGKESEDLPYLYWIPKLHKTPYKERYIAGSSTCSTKELSIHLTKILTYKHDIVGSLVRRDDNIFVMKRGKTQLLGL
jgi:hypothetical protein